MDNDKVVISCLAYSALMEIQNEQIGKAVTVTPYLLKNRNTVEIIVPMFDTDDNTLLVDNGVIRAFRIGAQLNLNGYGSEIQYFFVPGYLDLESSDDSIGLTEVDGATGITREEFNEFLSNAVSNWVFFKDNFKEDHLKFLSGLTRESIRLKSALISLITW